jgi:hypothetical protein
MDRLPFERKVKSAAMSHLDGRIPGVKQAVRKEIAAELANRSADHYAGAIVALKTAYDIERIKLSICPDCNGQGFLTIKRPSEPPDYHDCRKCDSSGEVAL